MSLTKAYLGEYPLELEHHNQTYIYYKHHLFECHNETVDISTQYRDRELYDTLNIYRIPSVSVLIKHTLNVQQRTTENIHEMETLDMTNNNRGDVNTRE